MFTKSLVTAAALWSLAGPATAITTKALGPATAGTTLTFAGIAGQGAFFADIFTFFLPPNRGSGYVISNFTLLDNLYNTVLSSLSLVRNLDGIIGNGDDTVLVTEMVGAAGGCLTVGGNAGGSYYLTVVGTTNGSQGDIYTGAISVTAAPVPEPGTYALMLAGLGAVGFVAARRRPRA